MTAIPIIGLFGCYCHPFSSWKECDKMHKQLLKVGQPVKNRHTDASGVVHKILEGKYWYTVKYGDLPRDLHLEHSANLIKI